MTGAGEAAIYNRTREIFDHFKLPYDIEPQGE